jgi:hypothetical protein
MEATFGSRCRSNVDRARRVEAVEVRLQYAADGIVGERDASSFEYASLLSRVYLRERAR